MAIEQAVAKGNALFVEVYFGYVAKHVTKTVANVSTPSTLHHVLTIGGFLMIGIEQRALAAAGAKTNVTTG